MASIPLSGGDFGGETCESTDFKDETIRVQAPDGSTKDVVVQRLLRSSETHHFVYELRGKRAVLVSATAIEEE